MKKLLLTIGMVALLSGCWHAADTPTSDNTVVTPTPSPAPETTILRGGELIDAIRDQERAPETKPYARLMITEVSSNASGVTADVWLENPLGSPVTSVRSFVAYNKQALRGVDITFVPTSPFTLVAPDEDSFDPLLGIAKIGVSTQELAVVTDERVHIATLRFERLSDTPTALDFFDVRDGGGTYVLMSTGDQGHVNILQQPAIPALFFPAAL